MKPSPRDLLIQKVREGKLTPAEAEIEAARLKLRPLEGKPEARKFDPATETWWSLPMAVSWIASRSMDDVREQWDAYRRECWMWSYCRWSRGARKRVYEGFDLVRRPHATWSELYCCAEENGERAELHEARISLWSALAKGYLKASGRDVQTLQNGDIPQEAWTSLKWREENGANVLGADSLEKAGYREVKLPSEKILVGWSPPPPSVEKLPEVMSPTGSGFMPLYCAAQWIATRGGEIETFDGRVWDDAYKELVDRIAANEIAVTGVRDRQTQRVDSVLFVGIEVDHLFRSEAWDLWGSRELYLRSEPYLNERRWREGHDDSLIDRFDRKWTRLMVSTLEVRRHWPFDLAHVDQEAISPPRTGAPGRPTSMTKVYEEFIRRYDGGESNKRLAVEAAHLRRWFEEAYRGWPVPPVKTITNRLRERYPEKFDLTRK